MTFKSDITKSCGNTPLIFIESASEKTGAKIFGKSEFFNPAGSVKDRIGLAMIEEGIKTGKTIQNPQLLNPQAVIQALPLPLWQESKV
jgi:cysteine synthase A